MVQATFFSRQDSIENLNIEKENTNSGVSFMLARSDVPDSHRRQADIYMILKIQYGMPVVNAQITVDEKKFLSKYDFSPLEYCTVKQVQDELKIMQKWNKSANEELIYASDKIIEIRVKELKSIIATRYIKISNEIYNGYKALERYLEEISKYHQK